MAYPPLTVLIPTHGRPTLLKRTLESLKSCTLPENYHEMVVIENGSRDGAEKLVAHLPKRLNARYMHRERGNKSYALNEAIETIKDGLVVFFDDDVRVYKDTLIKYAEVAEAYDGGVYFGGDVIPHFEMPPSDFMRRRLPVSERGYQIDRNRDNTFFLGFNWVAFASDIRHFGGFDPRFGPGSTLNAKGQESDMQRRMKAEGFEAVGVPGATVDHFVPKEHSGIRRIIDHQYRTGLADIYMSEGTLSSVFKGIGMSCGVFVRALLLGHRKDAFGAMKHIVYQIGRGVAIRRNRFKRVDERRARA